MPDDVIKNPLRTVPRTQTPYEPEHVRQNVPVSQAPVTPVMASVLGSSRKQPEPLPELLDDDSWASLDGDALDDDGKVIPFNNGHIIDNNDYVNLGYHTVPVPSMPNAGTTVSNDRKPMGPGWVDTSANIPVPPTEDNVTAPKVGDYILMVLGKLVTSGPIETIQTRVKNIMYGDDPAFTALEISMDDIVVLKRMNIKVGIFIDG